MNANVRLDPHDVTVAGRLFHIFPFPAFKAANLTGELAAVASPLLAGIAPMLTIDSNSILDVDIDKAAPAIGGAFQSLSGDKLESLLRKLLTQFQNITVETGDPGGAVWLTEDLVNTLFSGNVQDLFVLAFHVIKVNYAGFFARLGGPSGKVAETVMTLVNSSGTAD